MSNFFFPLLLQQVMRQAPMQKCNSHNFVCLAEARQTKLCERLKPWCDLLDSLFYYIYGLLCGLMGACNTAFYGVYRSAIQPFVTESYTYCIDT